MARLRSGVLMPGERGLVQIIAAENGNFAMGYGISPAYLMAASA
jgi:hypothetical protein